MKKILTISFNSGNYFISDDTKKVVIQGTDLILKGQDLFDNFYKDFKKTEPFEVTVIIDSSVVDSKDKYIAGEIKKILDDINVSLLKESNNATINNHQDGDIQSIAVEVLDDVLSGNSEIDDEQIEIGTDELPF